MITKENIKRIKGLSRKVNRVKEQQFVVEGVKNIQELLKSDFEIVALYVLSQEEWEGIETVLITSKDLDRITHLKNSNIALAVVQVPKDVRFDVHKTTIVLDGVNDPGNLGTIIRTADWFGIDQIVCSPNAVDCFNSKVVMSTMGSIFRVKIKYQDLSEFLSETALPNYSAVFDGVDLFETSFPKACNIVMGSESHGLSTELEPLINHKITIPGGVATESLNLSVSCSLFMGQYFKSIK